MPKKKSQALAALVFALSVCASAHAQLKIGHIATMSGPIGSTGQDQYDGFMLRLDQGAGKLGGQSVQLIRTDDQGKPENGLQIARELIEKEKVDIVVGVTPGNVSAAVFPYLTKAEVPYISTNGGIAMLAGEKCSPWFVSTAFQTDSAHEAGGQEARVRGYKKVILVVPNYQGGRDAVAGFKRGYQADVADELYPGMGQTDYSAELTQIQAASPDLVYTFLPGAMGINFVKQYAQAGLLQKVTHMTGFSVDDLALTAVQDAALGTIASAHWTAADTHPQSLEFVKAFREKYKRRASVYAMQGYDAAALLDQVLRAHPEAAKDKNALIKALRSAKFDSLRGPIVFERNGFPVQDYSIWKVVKSPAGEVQFELQNVALKAHHDAYVGQCPLK
jgi:branched-chain amino acid transport system substrate-binding protein